jgi:hypothetical protein
MYTPKTDQAFTRKGTKLFFPKGVPLDAPEDKASHWIYGKKGKRFNSHLANVLTVIFKEFFEPKYGTQKKFALAASAYAQQNKIDVQFGSQGFVSHLQTCKSPINKEHVALYSGMSGVPVSDIDPNEVSRISKPKKRSSAAGGNFLYIFESGEILGDDIGYSKIGIAKDIKKRLKDLKGNVAFPLFLHAHWNLGAGLARLVEKQVKADLKTACYSHIPSHTEIFRISPDDLWHFVYRAFHKVVTATPQIKKPNHLGPVVPPDLDLVTEQLKKHIWDVMLERDQEGELWQEDMQKFVESDQAWHPFDT